MSGNEITVRIAHEGDRRFIQNIMNEIEEASKNPQTGICKRSAATLYKKMSEGKAIIAVTEEGNWAGFCYIQSWSKGKYVSSCALIVSKTGGEIFQSG